MNPIKIIIILFLLQFNCYSQEFQKVYELVSNYSKVFSEPEELAGLINNDFDTELEKARAIYTWIALNINYDVVEYYSGTNRRQRYSYSSLEEKLQIEKNIELNTAKSTLKTNKGVCNGYSVLFKVLCDLCGVECKVINGSSKTKKRDIGKYYEKSDHAWNAIKIKGEWFLVDSTWGSGYLSSKKFIANYSGVWFKTNPNAFFLNHYPMEEKWLLTKKTKEDYMNLPLFYTNYLDSGVEIIQPKNGIITKAPKGMIKFQIKTDKEPLNFGYVYRNGQYLQKMEFEKQGDVYTFMIPIKNHKRGYLSIYLNQKSFVDYKLKIR